YEKTGRPQEPERNRGRGGGFRNRHTERPTSVTKFIGRYGLPSARLSMTPSQLSPLVRRLAPFARLPRLRYRLAPPMRLSDFDFELPPELIASRPAVPRDASRLLHVLGDRLEDRRFLDLPELLQPGDLLVFNDTKVIPARLIGRRGMATIEATLHHR